MGVHLSIGGHPWREKRWEANWSSTARYAQIGYWIKQDRADVKELLDAEGGRHQMDSNMSENEDLDMTWFTRGYVVWNLNLVKKMNWKRRDNYRRE